MDSESLAGLLKRIYNKFDMKSFENRLKLQKVIYLLQSQNMNLGYCFNFYLRGPYSTDLARNGFQIEDYPNIKRAMFVDKDTEKKFDDFLEKIDCMKNDTRWLECASSILFLKNYPGNKDAIFKEMKKRNKPFSDKYLEETWEKLCDFGWIND